MPKFMNMRNMYFSKLDLQLFAGDDDAGDDSGDGDDQDDDTDEGGEDEPKYTQADLDKAVARTIAKERAKAERAEKSRKTRIKVQTEQTKTKMLRREKKPKQRRVV